MYKFGTYLALVSPAIVIVLAVLFQACELLAQVADLLRVVTGG